MEFWKPSGSSVWHPDFSFQVTSIQPELRLPTTPHHRSVDSTRALLMSWKEKPKVIPCLANQPYVLYLIVEMYVVTQKCTVNQGRHPAGKSALGYTWHSSRSAPAHPEGIPADTSWYFYCNLGVNQHIAMSKPYVFPVAARKTCKALLHRSSPTCHLQSWTIPDCSLREPSRACRYRRATEPSLHEARAGRGREVNVICKS